MSLPRGQNYETYLSVQLIYQHQHPRKNKHWKAPTSDIMTLTSTPRKPTLTSLPPELLLNMIPLVEYHPDTIRNLALTCRTFHDLLTTHETTLVRAIKHQALPPNTLQLYPSLPTKDYDSLCQLHSRLQTLHLVHTHWLHITSNTPDLSWLKGRWEHIHKAGLLLLYRLQDTPTHDQRLAMLASWPATTLACLMFKLVSGVRILRTWGAEPVKLSRGAMGIGSGLGDEESRCEVELCCEEMMLVHGPDFFVSMLEAGKRQQQQGIDIPAEKRKENWAVRALCSEIAYMDERQIHGTSPTLISALRRGFARSLDGDIAQNAGKMWEVLSSTAFDQLGEEKMIEIVNGVDLAAKGKKGGMKRMGF